MGSSARAKHWNTAYERGSTTGVSWFQPEASVSLRLIESLGVGPDAPIIDIGGGASTLADGLIDRGFIDVSVLDVSQTALDAARKRLGSRAAKVQWLCQDLLAWTPPRRYAVWHDRAVYHFLVDVLDRRRYADILKASIADDGHVVLATFAPDGPDKCSGLPVARYGPSELVAGLGEFKLVATEREEHVTPTGHMQPFTWVVAR